MDQLYIEIEINTRNDNTEIYSSVESFMALYMYRYLQSPSNIKLNFVRTTIQGGKLRLRTESLRRELTEEKIHRKEATSVEAIRDLRLPIYAKDENTYIAGMCAVCRELVGRQECLERRKLLGFKGACLLAPAESSIWTRFCEVDIVDTMNRLLCTLHAGGTLDEIPMEVPRFERHMNEPVRMHNIYKTAREQAQQQNPSAGSKKKNKVILDCSVPKEQLPIEHRFAEGISFTIADIILYTFMRLIFKYCKDMLVHFPLINTWLSEIDTFDLSCGRILNELYLHEQSNESTTLLTIPDCEPSSLYKSDPKRYKPRNRIFTEQSEVDAALKKLEKLQLQFTSESTNTYERKHIDWEVIEPEQEKNSALPRERVIRKRQQLQNVANAVVSLAITGNRIIDFCSGTGHLGILLALQLPDCIIILMENKAISLERAKQRATQLGLKNCRFYQCNIDYFEGNFDVGTSLHACGTATDIVLQQCRRSRAGFVCCPCCYGSLQPMPHIAYPLSERFRRTLTERDYLYIAHTADQAHEMGTLNCRPETTLQGQLCMDIIDTDRKLQAEEDGYDVILTRLKPEQCTPKNRLLVGRITQNS
ncbi:glutathione S-transferase C-terminal domain-containing protein homolog [Zeugodacus cucurbitae]|uniref:glutathione S-transferase C-terminal domain-containing protein homolog n=1 Tax=Zeugodacus cucurbitae TaxID=28588 RepID=UPI0005969E94|nr:glutathione S-transferase C-terminal domain-containing protein homolog [Zeugodacus cucurbitae]